MDIKTATLNITGMTCASCAATVQKELNHEKRIDSASVNIVTEKAQVVFDAEKISKAEIVKIIKKAGFGVANKDSVENKTEQKIKKARNTFLWSLFFGVPLLYITMGEMIGIPVPAIPFTINLLIQFILTTIIMAVNFQIYASGLKKLLSRNPNMDSLVEIGTLAAYFYSLAIFVYLVINPEATTQEHVYFESAGFILVFISLGKYLEEKTKGKTGEAIKKLIGLQPKTAVILIDNKELEVHISEVKKGDIVVIKPGEKIPVDGEIVFGKSTLDESAITGESIPVSKKIKDKVIGGTLNKTGVLHFKTTGVGEETMLAQIVQIMEAAVASKAPVQLLADKVSFYFVPTVMAIAIVTFLIWYLLGFGFTFALTAFVSVLIIACPCSLGLATPTAVMMGTGLAASRGILIKNAKALETAHKVDTIVFDKTGTLTKGKPEVVQIKAFGKKSTPEFCDQTEIKQLLEIAFSLAKNSHHPISAAIAQFGKMKKIQPLDLVNFQEIEGKGLEGKIKDNEAKILLGNQKLLEDYKISIPTEVRKVFHNFAESGKTPLFVVREKKIIGILGIMDDVKTSSLKAIEEIKKKGKKIVMLSGDHQKVAEAIADKLGIEEVIAEVFPGEKAEKIKQLQKQGKTVAMVGDGINDAPALAQADLGISLGAGTDIALEAGKIILVKNDLRDVVRAMEISEYTLRKIKQNLFWAFFYNSAGIPIAAGVLYPLFGFLLNPMLAAFAMSFSSVSVVSNSLLMRFYRDK